MAFIATIIGRPNVGKSTLFNRLTGTRAALVDNTPGLTRDRREGEVELGELRFTLIDTAGLEEAENESVEAHMMAQTEIAIEQADLLLMVIDGREGVTPMDQHFVETVRKQNKPVMLIANKCESANKIADEGEMYALGLGEPVYVSAEHGLGLDAFYHAMQPFLENAEINDEDDEEAPLQVALVGRPNAGKSTLFNKLLGEERSIAGDVAGMTRDAIYVDWEWKGSPVRLVDTAGLRRKSKRHDTLEKLAVSDSMKAIQYANVVIMMVDATLGLDKQDQTLVDHIIAEGRGLVLALNKWDVAKDKQEILDEIDIALQYSISQARTAPVVTVSGLTGNNIPKLMKAVEEVFEQWNRRISTGKLNRWLAEAVERHPPPLSHGRRINLKYATQIKTRPPTFALFTSSKVKDLPESYKRYLSNSLRDAFDMQGTPIRLHIRKQNNPYN